MNPFKLTATIVLLWLGTLSPPSAAQQLDRDAFEDLTPPTGSEAAPAVPSMTFRLLAEIALPGPLPGSGPHPRGDDVEIAVAGGTAVTAPEPDATPRVESSAAGPEQTEESDPWVEDGKSRRYRSLPGGWIVAERKCDRCKRGWKKSWKLRVPGNTLAPPLVGGDRVYFGALDNRVYCVKAKNGHRLWVTEVEGRASRPLALWNGPDDSPADPEVVLVVTDSGRELLALSGANGVRVAAVQILPADGRLVDVPLALPDGKIVVAQQKYTESEAALRVYRLSEIAPAGPQDQVDYNGPDLRPNPTTEGLDGAAEGRVEGQDDQGAGSQGPAGTLPGHAPVPEGR